MLELTDTHCHIQSAGIANYPADATANLWAKLAGASASKLADSAAEQGVKHLICVGCTLTDSKLAADFAAGRQSCWASIGLHPHEADQYVDNQTLLDEFEALVSRPKVVAVGEAGLDYYYNHSSKSNQIKLLRFQLDLAQKHNLPVIFHVREAFADFWPIFDEYKGIKGVIHSFTGDKSVLKQILDRGLYVGLNGIMTFTKDQSQLDMAKSVPLASLLLETDAPYLTPVPFRGKICEPKHTKVTAEFLANLRGESLDELAGATTANAKELFNLVNQ